MQRIAVSPAKWGIPQLRSRSFAHATHKVPRDLSQREAQRLGMCCWRRRRRTWNREHNPAHGAPVPLPAFFGSQRSIGLSGPVCHACGRHAQDIEALDAKYVAIKKTLTSSGQNHRTARSASAYDRTRTCSHAPRPSLATCFSGPLGITYFPTIADIAWYNGNTQVISGFGFLTKAIKAWFPTESANEVLTS